MVVLGRVWAVPSVPVVRASEEAAETVVLGDTRPEAGNMDGIPAAIKAGSGTTRGVSAPFQRRVHVPEMHVMKIIGGPFLLAWETQADGR